MDVYGTLDARRRMLRTLRHLDQPKRLVDPTVTVEVSDDALSRITAIRQDLPPAAVEYPTEEKSRWYWRDSPAVFIYPKPIELDFVVTSTTINGEVTHHDRPMIDTQRVLAHWVLPPHLYDRRSLLVDEFGDLLDDDGRDVLAGMVINFGLSIAVDDEGAITSAHLPWGEGLIQHPAADRIGTDGLHIAAMVRGIAAGALVVASPRMKSYERRAIARSKAAYFHLDVPRVGATLAGRTEVTHRPREHYTRFGERKRALSHKRADELVAANPGLTKYVCSICRKVHVGNER